MPLQGDRGKCCLYPGCCPGLGASALYLSLRPVTVGSGRIARITIPSSFLLQIPWKHNCRCPCSIRWRLLGALQEAIPLRLRQSTVDILAGDSILDQSEYETGIEVIAGSDGAHRLHLLRRITLGKAVLGSHLYRLSAWVQINFLQ